MLSRPILGGVFGRGQYELATMPCISKGLHAVRYLVVHLAAGQVVSIAEDKREALSCARQLLKDAVPASAGPHWRQPALWPEIELVPASRAPSVSRRRREIFGKSDGRCHYCRTPLTLDGAWHVEHMLPRALNGTDDPLNLVAACVECNQAKGPRSALEFVVAASGRA